MTSNFDKSRMTVTIQSDSVGDEWTTKNVRFHGMTLAEVKADIREWLPLRKSPLFKRRMNNLLNASDLVLITK